MREPTTASVHHTLTMHMRKATHGRQKRFHTILLFSLLRNCQHLSTVERAAGMTLEIAKCEPEDVERIRAFTMILNSRDIN